VTNQNAATCVFGSRGSGDEESPDQSEGGEGGGEEDLRQDVCLKFQTQRKPLPPLLGGVLCETRFFIYYPVFCFIVDTFST